MKNWLLGQGIPFYAELLLAVSGLIVLWMTGRIYKRLLREADLMGSSNQKLIKYIRLKVASYFKIGMHPEDTQALIGRYIKKYRVGPFSLQAWSRLPYLIMTAMLAIGGGNFMYRWTRGGELDRISNVLFMAVLGVVVISGCMLFMDFVSKEKIKRFLETNDDYYKLITNMAARDTIHPNIIEYIAHIDPRVSPSGLTWLNKSIFFEFFMILSRLNSIPI